MKAAKKSHDSHTVEIKELETELETVEAKRAEFEEQIEQESQSQGRDLTLEESQVWIRIQGLHQRPVFWTGYSICTFMHISQCLRYHSMYIYAHFTMFTISVTKLKLYRF